MKAITDRIKVRGTLAVTSLATGLATSQGVFAQGNVKKGVSEGVADAEPSSGSDQLFGEGGTFQTIANILLFVVGAISVLMLIVGGIRYVVSAGDQQAVTNAKNTILYAIVGIVLAFIAFAAVQFVTNALEA